MVTGDLDSIIMEISSTYPGEGGRGAHIPPTSVDHNPSVGPAIKLQYKLANRLEVELQ